MGPFDNAATFLIQTFFDLYLLIIALRLLLQFFGANYFNPVCQFIIKATDLFVKPLKFLPRIKNIDVGVVLLFLVISAIKFFLLAGLGTGHFIVTVGLPILAVADLLTKLVSIFFFTIIIRVILSWFPAAQNHPAYAVLFLITEPVMRPARNIVPSIGSLDLSPIAVLLVLKLLEILIVTPLTAYGLGLL